MSLVGACVFTAIVVSILWWRFWKMLEKQMQEHSDYWHKEYKRYRGELWKCQDERSDLRIEVKQIERKNKQLRKDLDIAYLIIALLTK